jgi:integrase
VKTKSREGYQVDTNSRRWVLSRDVAVNLGWVDQYLEESLRTNFLKMASWCASAHAAGSVSSTVAAFKAFSKSIAKTKRPIKKITVTDLLNFKAYLGPERQPQLWPLVIFLRHWLKKSIPGVEPGVQNLLKTWKIKANPKGVAIRTRCPRKGALTDLEQQSLEAALTDSFASRKTSLSTFVLADLMISTGRRPSQVGDLKLCDLLPAGKQEHEDCGLVIRFPRCKQGRAWRVAFRPAYLTAEKAGAVLELKALIHKRLKRFWPSITDSEVNEFPLFPVWQRIRKHRDASFSKIMRLARSEAFHQATDSLSDRLTRLVKRLGVMSERTSEPLRVFPLRLRRSFATRAAREGCGVLVIAELLDHSDGQNAGVYTENVPEHAAAIDAAVAMQLAPIVQAFSGMLVDKEADALRGNDIASRIRMDDGRNVGSCGSFAFCGALSPVACYTCKAFQPWLDAPHADVLSSLIAERERVRDVTRDEAISSINDRTILAVAQVIRLCDQRRIELKENSHE